MFVSALVATSLLHSLPQQSVARGIVFNDVNKNGRYDSGDRGISGVRVSDQHDFTTTDSQGHWSMPLRSDDVRFFVVKPRGWMTPVNEHQLPQFYYNHKPNGSPETRFPGVEPTGDLPSLIEFPLYPNKEPEEFQALFFGDTQPRDVREIDYVRRDIVEPIVGKHDAAFGITLGDLVFDDLAVLDPYVRTIALLGIPWYNVVGNHDINFDHADDHLSDETFERYFGPNYYSFDHGPIHVVVLDNVWWSRNPETDRGGYSGQFGEEQLAWLKKDLAGVPKDKLVVLTMHIPIMGVGDKEAFFNLIEDRPFTLSVSAHTHTHEHHFIGKDQGFDGEEPHHHVVNVTTSGSWWQGDPDEYGIPHTTMRDGAPNGYSIFKFDGNQYSIQFRAARRPETYQMEIIVPDLLMQPIVRGTEFYVNVFGGSSKSKVEVRFDDDPNWVEMQYAQEQDPSYVKMYEKSRALTTPYRVLPGPANSTHLWKSVITAKPERGMMKVHVRTTDMFGQTFMATRGIRIL